MKSNALRNLYRYRAWPRRVAVVPLRIGPGPAAKVCPQSQQGQMRCMAWIRTDIIRPKTSIPYGYGPSDLQSAYKLTAASSVDGGGQTVAIVDAYDDPSAEADLTNYRATFGLPACTTSNGCFLKVNEEGDTSPLPSTDASGGWESEESLDLDMVSAICPKCDIVLIVASSNDSPDLYSAVDTAASTCGAEVVSNSWNGGEYEGEQIDEVNFDHPGVMITVAAGDNGYPNTGYPSTSAYVTSVGGTTLNDNGGDWSETVWPGSGSVCSQYIAQPAWQTSLGSPYTSICGMRIDNDVAAIGDPNTGVAVFDSNGGSDGCGGWCVYGGTSVATPIIGSVYALAGNEATLTFGSYSYSHTSSLNDITSGSNGSCGDTFLCTAGVGYDGPTGNGTPKGLGAF
jgi:subtilase family serine protease